jgi:hypothetical protein
MSDKVIRKKRVYRIYPNGLTFVSYDFSDIEQASWWDDLTKCIEVIKMDCQKCWPELLYDYFNVFNNTFAKTRRKK